jgi:GH18 family chitinase
LFWGAELVADPQVRRKASRSRFVTELVAFLRLHRLDGVDYNWEYPGYQFGRGYLPDQEVGVLSPP